MGNQVQKVGILLVAILISMISLTVFSDSLLTNVTNAASDSFTAQDSTTATTVTLTSPHWFTDISELSVTGSTSGAFTLTNASTTLDDARTQLTIQAQSPGNASETITVSYVTEDTESQGTVGWKLVPLFLILISLAAVGGAIFTGIQHGRQGNVSALLVAIGILFIGVIVGEVVKTFTDDAVDLYALQPDYTGVGSLLPIVDLGYVFALFGIAAGGVVGYGSKVFRG